MKIFLSLVSLLAFSITGFSQNTVQLSGFMLNAPEDSVSIETTFNSTPPYTVILHTENDGNIQPCSVEVPGNWTAVRTQFVNCLNHFVLHSLVDSSFDNTTDIFLNLDFCEDSTSYVYGCTDPAAINYDPQATMNYGLCSYASECDQNLVTVSVYTGRWPSEISWKILKDSNEVAHGSNYKQRSFGDIMSTWCLDDGCYVLQMFDSFGDGWDGVQIQVGDSVTHCVLQSGYFNQIAFGINQQGCTVAPIYGCTDQYALNFDHYATADDGSCEYPGPLAVNDYCADAIPLSEGTVTIDNSHAFYNEGIMAECWNVFGPNQEQSSVWYTFTTPDVPATIHLETSFDGSNTLVNTEFGIFQECGGPMIYCDENSGEGYMSDLDFFCGELPTNTTYYLVVNGWQNNRGTCFLTYSVDTNCTIPGPGCTDPSAINYDPAATIDNGSCYYSINCTPVHLQISGAENSSVMYHLSSPYGTALSGTYHMATDSFGLYSCLYDGCYNLTFNSDSLHEFEYSLSTENDSLILSDTFWANSYSVNFIIGGGCDSASISGCTDPYAVNYDPNAFIDDGSCYYTHNCDISFVSLSDSIGFEDVIWIYPIGIEGASSILWDFGDGITSTETYPQHTYEDGGPYNLCLTASFEYPDGVTCTNTYCEEVSSPDSGNPGFGPDSFTINVINNAGPTAIDERNTDLPILKLWPNPVTHQLFIQFSNPDQSPSEFNIYDIAGKNLIVKKIPYSRADGIEIIDVNNLPSGLYILTVTNSKTTQTVHFVKTN